MEIRVVDRPRLQIQPVPNMSLEKSWNGGFTYPEYGGQRVIRMAYNCIRKVGSLIWSPVEDTSGGFIALQSVKSNTSSASIESIWSDALGRPVIKDRGPMLPFVSVTEKTQVPANERVGVLTVSFRGMWPKTGRYSIVYDSALLKKLVQELEPYGQIFEYVTAARLARLIGMQSGHLDIRTIEGGEVATRLIEDFAIQNIVERIGVYVTRTNLRLKDDIAEGTWADDVITLDDADFNRTVDLLAP